MVCDRLHAQPEHPCFAFLLHGDVHVVCEGRKDQVTHRRNIGSFAVSDERSALAYVTSRVTNVSNGVATSISTTTIIDLNTMRAMQRTGDNYVLSTCGGIFWMTTGMRDRSDTRDLLTGKEIASPPYKWFRCSANRSIAVGTPDERAGDLSLHRSGQAPVTVARAGTYNVWTFDISPGGYNVAYFADHKPLCALVGTGPIACANESAVDRPSINNSGEILVAINTLDGCYHRSATDFSPAPANRSNDVCIGIGYWKPGLKAIQLVESLGNAPQWISAATAKLLRALGAKGY